MDGDTRETADIAVQILSSSLLDVNPVSTQWRTLFHDSVTSASRDVPTRTLFKLIPSIQSRNTCSYLLWVAQLPEASSISAEDARERCVTYLRSSHKPEFSCVLLLKPNDSGYDNDKSAPRSILIVLSTLPDAVRNGASLSDQDVQDFAGLSNERNTSSVSSFMKRLASWAPWYNRWTRRHLYETVTSSEIVLPESRQSQWSRQLIRFFFLPFIAIMLLMAVFLIIRGHKDTIYDRYDTAGSDGPRHQLRIYWQNASEWAAANPPDSGKWKVRIDDQAIIPAELYDDDEDRYQSWYRTRYPEMQQVIDNYDYIRPSWMGSLNMKVPWDDQFHFAHCVLALRRYWKAKETGKHVCGRDIDYLHIDHCLGSLEKRVFIEGPRDVYHPPIYMYWQTKVCF